MAFVDADAIPPSCYDEPYCLSPSKNDSKAYDVLREIMQRTRKVGLVVIEKQQALAAVIPIGRTLVLNVLRFATGLVPGRRDSPVVTKPSIGREISGRKPPISGAESRQRPEARIATLPVPKVIPARRRAPAPLIVAEKTTARVARVSDGGEVIDLAIRRSSKRATSPSSAKTSRVGARAVATLHDLSGKKGVRAPVTERQLA